MRKCESFSSAREENELVVWKGKARPVYQETIGVMDMQLSIILLQGGLSDCKDELETLKDCFGSQPADQIYTYPSSSSASASSRELAIRPASASLLPMRLLIMMLLIKMLLAFNLIIYICIILLKPETILSKTTTMTYT